MYKLIKLLTKYGLVFTSFKGENFGLENILGKYPIGSIEDHARTILMNQGMRLWGCGMILIIIYHISVVLGIICNSDKLI